MSETRSVTTPVTTIYLQMEARFLMIRREGAHDRPQQQLNVVVNWVEELKQLDANR